MKKQANAKERQYLGKVASLGCAMCHMMGYGHSPAQVHHVRAGQGMSQRSQHYATVPLCEPHHTGSKGWHGTRFDFKLHSIDEIDMLAWVNQKLNES
jgi:hypothetical protein